MVTPPAHPSIHQPIQPTYPSPPHRPRRRPFVGGWLWCNATYVINVCIYAISILCVLFFSYKYTRIILCVYKTSIYI